MAKVYKSKWKIKIFLCVFLSHLEFHFLSDVALQESTFCMYVHRLTQHLCSVPMKFLRTNSVFSTIFCSNCPRKITMLILSQLGKICKCCYRPLRIFSSSTLYIQTLVCSTLTCVLIAIALTHVGTYRP